MKEFKSLTADVLCFVIIYKIATVVGNPDPSMTDFQQIATPSLKQGVATPINFKLRINNLAATAAANNIAKVTGTAKNFQIVLKYSNNDMAATFNTLTLADLTPSISLADVQQKLDANGGYIDIPGTITLTVPVAECNQIRYLCAVTSPGSGSTYTDANNNNNAACQSIISQKSCAPDTAVTALSFAGTKLYQATPTTIPFTIDISNNGATTPTDHGNNVHPLTGTDTNFQFTFHLTDVDKATAIDTLAITPITPAITLQNLQKGINAGDPALTIGGNVVIDIPAEHCTRVKYLCVVMAAASKASYIDSVTTNNVKCNDILPQKVCGSDTKMSSLVLQSSTFFLQGHSTSFTFKADIMVSGENIPAASAPNKNFKISLKFAEFSNGTDTLGLSSILATITPDSDLEKALVSGIHHAITVTGSTTLTLSPANCQKVHYLCVHVDKGVGAVYLDADTTNNYFCNNIDTRKSCVPSLSLTDFVESASPKVEIIEDLSTAFYFKASLRNVAPVASGNEIWPVTSPNANFNMTLRLTDADTVNGGTDTLGLPLQYATFSHTSQVTASLAPTAGSLLEGYAYVTIPEGKCKGNKFVCAKVFEGTGASYVDAVKTDNEKCIDVSSQRVCIPKLPTLPAHLELFENQTTSAVIYNIPSEDGDGGTVTLTMIKITPGAPFSFNPTTNQLSVDANPGFDFEGGPKQYVLQITASDSRFHINKTITITILDSPEPPSFFNIPSNVTTKVNENYMGWVFTAIGKDPDAGSTFTYSLKPEPAFAMDSTTGQLTVVLPGGLDYENINLYRLYITVTDNTGLSSTEILWVEVLDVNEAPTLTNLPDTVYLPEDFPGTTDVYKLTATDPDANTTLRYILAVTPDDGVFYLHPPPDGDTVRLNSSIGLDYEKNAIYQIVVNVNDGTLPAVSKVLTVNITDVNEIPWIFNLPATVKVPEAAVTEAKIFEVNALDPEKQPLSYHYTVTPTTGYIKFGITSDGFVKIVQNPGFSYALVKKYTVTVRACDPTNLCESKPLTVQITDTNDPPYFSPNQTTISLDEKLPISTTVPVTLNVVDPDAGDTTTFSLAAGAYSSWFDINPTTGKVTIKKTLDYEDPLLPPQITIVIKVVDKGGQDDLFFLTININNLNDHTPVFNPTTYTATLAENTIGGTNVISVKATDTDAGSYGVVTYSVAPGLGDYYFEIVKQSDGSGLLKVKHPVDREAISSVTFDVYAHDPDGRNATGSVTVTITDVNDNRPVFDKNFYNMELRNDAAIGTSIGPVSATDGDVTGNTTSYTILPGQGNEKEFAMNSSHGILSNAVTPLIIGKMYKVYTVAQDSGTPIDYSVPVMIRMDAFDPELYLTDWEMEVPISDWTDAKKQEFLNALGSICSPCKPGISSIKQKDSTSVNTIVTVYFLVDNSTDSGDLTLPKQFIHKDLTLGVATIDDFGTPSSNVKTAPFANTKVIRVTATIETIPPVPINWWLDTLEGNLTMAAIILGGLLLIALAAFILYRLCRTTRVPVGNLDKGPLGPWDARYNEKAHANLGEKPKEAIERTPTQISIELPGTPEPPDENDSGRASPPRTPTPEGDKEPIVKPQVEKASQGRVFDNVTGRVINFDTSANARNVDAEIGNANADALNSHLTDW